MSTTAPKHPASPNVDEPVAKTARTEKGGAEEVKMEEEGAGTTAAAAKGAPATTEAAAGTSAAQPIDVEMEEARSMEKQVGRASGEAVGPSSNAGDVKRMWEKHEDYEQSQKLLAKLPELFPDYRSEEVNSFLVWLAQLPVSMHRPRPTLTGGWKAAGEIMTCQWDEKLPSLMQKMISNNISALPVLDQHRRYLGVIDTMSIVIHALKAFGIMDPAERAESLKEIAIATASINVAVTEGSAAAGGTSTTTAAAAAAAAAGVGKADAEMKLEGAAAATSSTEGAKMIQSMAPPVHVMGGAKEFAGRPIWDGLGDKADWAERWERRTFQECRACDLIAEEVPTLGGTGAAQVIVSELSLPAPSVEVLAPPLQQGSSTLFAIELVARMGLHRVPILNSDRFLTGLITESMLISLISQFRHKITSFQGLTVNNMLQFLAPHRLVIVDEDAIAAQAFSTFVKQRVTGGAVVNKAGVLVDVLSSRDLRGIGRRGQEFERLWLIVREFKEIVRKEFPDKTPREVNFVYGSEKMVDVLSKMNDGNLHRVIVCEQKKDLPHPIAVITQRDVLRMLLVFLGETLQGENRIAMA